MPISKHLEKFEGRPVVDYKHGQKLSTKNVYRVGSEVRWGQTDSTLLVNLHDFLAMPNVSKVTALVIGVWDGACDGNSPEEAIEQLVGARQKLPNLKSLFFGDITYREYEISWLQNGDVSSLFSAYPKLETAVFRGAAGLTLGLLNHKKLKKLVIQSGGLPGRLVREVNRSQLPSLTHLELWLGASEYGGDATLDDLAPILDGKKWPKLRYLGLRNREKLNEIATEIASSPVIRKLDILDLSMASLNDEEAAPLLKISALKKLKTLDLSQNFLTKDCIKEFKKAGIKLKADDQRTPDRYDEEEYRYIVISE